MAEVIGNNLASLICCVELVGKGIPVHHVVESGRRIGGHFGGLPYQNTKIDLGMVLLEPRLEVDSTDITQYQGEFGRELNQFNKAVFDWLDKRNIELNKIEVCCFFNNKIIGDLIISDDLSLLAELDHSEQNQIIRELKDRQKSTIQHPKDKLEAEYFINTGLSDVYIALYGPTFSKYLLSNLDLLAGSSGSEISARFHRSLWAPLYYPENIIKFLESGNSGILNLDFYVPSCGSISKLVQAISSQLESSKSYSQDLVSREQYSSIVDQLILTESLDAAVFSDDRELRDFKIQIPTVDIGFVVAETESSKNCIIHNLEPTSPWYRAVLRGEDEGIVLVELGKISADESDYMLFERAQKCLLALGVVSWSKPAVFRSKIACLTPSVSNEIENSNFELSKNFESNRSFFRSNELTGSFNNQVCLGLKSATILIEGFRGE